MGRFGLCEFGGVGEQMRRGLRGYPMGEVEVNIGLLGPL